MSNELINQDQACNHQLDFVLYEYPLKEQVRNFLRLESLFIQFERNLLAVHSDNHLHALKIFFEILEILERGDTRAELTKELGRLAETFTKLSLSPSVDLKKLEQFLQQIKQLQQWVLNYQGKFGDKLRKHPFIDSVRHRASIPGGNCAFDSPDLFLFLNQSHTKRQQQLKLWLDDIIGVKTSIEVILRIMREYSLWQPQVAPLGSYMIDTSEKPAQLLRIKIIKDLNIFPEFSCGKHRSNIHFMRYDDNYKKLPQQREIKFELACCH
jgi:cell division protein ZapD